MSDLIRGKHVPFFREVKVAWDFGFFATLLSPIFFKAFQMDVKGTNTKLRGKKRVYILKEI